MKWIVMVLISTVIALAAEGLAQVYAAKDPYRVWFISLLDHAFDRNTCPADWTFAALQKGHGGPDGHRTEAVSVAAQELLSDRFPRAPNALSRTAVDGRGGVDTLTDLPAGYVNVDGHQVVSIERLSVVNGWPNIVHVLLSGLATTEERSMMIYGDRTVDMVFLDGCIRWGWPELLQAESGRPERYRMTATDGAGETGSIEFAASLPVRRLHSRRVTTWASIIRKR